MLHRAGMRAILWTMILLLAAPAGISAQQGSEGPQLFRPEELDQMLAPVALYPDDLLVQVLMAATYPLEIVQAARWARSNPNVTGDALAVALEGQDWDPSVKSLVAFPQVLAMLDEHLDWTQKLGDAFLAQKDEVMDSVQKLRERAQAQGNLQTTDQQRIVTEEGYIRIEPPTPEVVYVPVYDPVYVYGPWWYPAYPPYHYHPPGVVIAHPREFFVFGVTLGAAWGYAWGGFHWRHHDVFININRHVHINRRIDRHRYVNVLRVPEGGRGTWVHSPMHRKGIAYRDPGIARQFGQQRPGAETRRDFRGFDGPRGRAPVLPSAARPPTVSRVQPERHIGQASRPGQPRTSTAPPAVVTPPPRTVTPEPRTVTPPPRTVSPKPRTVTPPPRPTPAQPPAQPSPRVAASPPRAAAPPVVQQRRDSGAFGGIDHGSAAKQFSNRGHQSVSNAGRGGGQRPAFSQGGAQGKGGRRR